MKSDSTRIVSTIVLALVLIIGIANAAVPTAYSSVTPTTGSAPLTVFLSDQSIGLPTTWGWTYTGKNLVPINFANGLEDGTLNDLLKWNGNEVVTSDTSGAFQGTRAIKIVTPNLVSGEGIACNQFNVLPSTQYTMSAYLKGSGTVYLYAYEYDSGGNYVSGNSFGSITLNNTWTRYSAYKTTAATAAKVWITIRTSPQQAATIYVDDVQYELGSVATVFSTVPRANLLTYTQQLDNAFWTKYQVSVVQDSAVAPDGTVTADLSQELAVTDAHAFYVLPSTVPGTSYVASIYAKARDRNWMSIQFTESGGQDHFAAYNLSSGTLGNYNGGNPSIQYAGNGWYRCILTIPAVAKTSASYAFYNAVDGANTFTYPGDVTKGNYYWGAQLETGSVATPYFANPENFGFISSNQNTAFTFTSPGTYNVYLRVNNTVGNSTSQPTQITSTAGNVVIVGNESPLPTPIIIAALVASLIIFRVRRK